MRHFAFLSAFALFLLFVPQAQAQTLTADKVERFVASLTDVNVMAQGMKESGKNEVINARMQPVPGQEFTPYSRAVSTLKTEFPEDYTQLENITSQHGFSSAEEWGSVGNNVMKAFLANEMGDKNQENLAMAETQITPEMLAQMPPEARAGFEQGISMMRALKDVPAEDRALVQPHMEQIKQAMEE